MIAAAAGPGKLPAGRLPQELQGCASAWGPRPTGVRLLWVPPAEPVCRSSPHGRAWACGGERARWRRRRSRGHRPEVIPMAEATAYFRPREQRMHRRFHVDTAPEVRERTASPPAHLRWKGQPCRAKDDRALELAVNRRRVGSVVREPAQRVRRRENGVTVTDEPVEHRPRAGRVCERAVNENNGGTRHDEFLMSLMDNWAARCWIHQAIFSRWLRPRASTTLDCTGATSSLAWSEPNGAPTTVRTARLPLA